MNIKKGIWFVLGILLLLVGSAEAQTFYLDPSSNGDGVINDAMDQAGPGDVVWLRSGIFWVDDTIDIANGVTLKGEGEVKLVDDVGWNSGKTMFYSTGDNIRIEGITIDGNSQGNTGVPFGAGYYGLFLFRNSDDVVFDSVTLEYAKSDGIIFRNGNGITVNNCKIWMMGHEGLYALYSDDVTFTNNTVFTRTNSACRIASGEHVLISNNEIYSGTITSADGGGSSTGPGIEINIDAGQPARDIEISRNYIHDLRGSAIWMTSESTQGDGVYIHNNIFTDVGNYPSDNRYSTAGITIWQFNATLIENNVFDDTGIAGVRYAKRAADGVVKDDFVTIVRNNVFINIKDKITITAEPIMNTNPERHTFYVYNNNFFNNYDVFDGELCVSWSNFYLNPKFADAFYHLKSDSELRGLGFNGADLGAYGTGSDVVGVLPSTGEDDDTNTDLDNGTVDHDDDTPNTDVDNGTCDNDGRDDDDDGCNEDLDNGTWDHDDDQDPNTDLDNGTVEHEDDQEPNTDLDNATSEHEDDTNEDLDNGTYDWTDTHGKERTHKGTGKAVVVTPKIEMLVGHAHGTRPTFKM